MKFSPLTCYLISPRPKYSPQQTIQYLVTRYLIFVCEVLEARTGAGRDFSADC
jgi:hypothetical protein